MSNGNFQKVRYLIFCTLLGLAFALPIADVDNNNKTLKRTTTSTTTVNPNLLHTNLRTKQQHAESDDLNSMLILEPIVQNPMLLETSANLPNQRLRRTLTQAQLNEPVDVDFDMELDEVNVFRPLFRYRAEVARNLGRTQQVG